MATIPVVADLRDPGRFFFYLGISLCLPGLFAETFLALFDSEDFDFSFSRPEFLYFHVEELPRLDKRASSPLMYFFALASTSAMLACGFFEIENIRSLGCTPSLAIKEMMANFSFGMSTLNDSELNL